MSHSHLITSLPTFIFGAIPSPSQGVWWLGPIPIRAYGILLTTGIFLATWIAYRRYVGRGGSGEVILDTALWAIPFGIIGGRMYHVVTTPYSYFGPGKDPWEVVRIWNGGMAIWGAVALGALGAVIALRRAGQRVGPVADALAPGILVGQVLGRWGNYFNQELFGGPTTLPWGLEIDPQNLPPGYAEGTLFHPTFLYEGIWNLAVLVVLLVLERRLDLRAGQLFGFYLIGYGTGRFLLEFVRIDEARQYLGLRLNAWTALGVILLGVVIVLLAQKRNAPSRVAPSEVAVYEARQEGGKRNGKEDEPAGQAPVDVGAATPNSAGEAAADPPNAGG